MIILLHVLIALASIGTSTATFIKPSTHKLRINYAFIAATIISGLYLIIAMSSDVLRSCLTGLGYIALVSGLTLASRVRLAKSSLETR